MISDIDDDATLVIHAQVDSWTFDLISSYFMTTSSEGWPEALTKSVVAQISRYRKERGLSYQQLADKCTNLGYPTLRTTLANLEAGKRKSLTLHELIILAAALEVPPVQLIFPGIPDGEMRILPNKTQNAWEALQWFTGETPTLDPADAPAPTDPNYHIALIRDMKYGVRQGLGELVTDEELENIGSGDATQDANLAFRMVLNAMLPDLLPGLLKNVNLDVLRKAGFTIDDPKDDTDV